MKVLLNSSEDTPDEDKIFVIENPATSREKKRYGDIVKEIEYCDTQTQHIANRKIELEVIKGKMDVILSK